MTERTDLQSISERDQDDAALNDLTRQVARHFLMMRATKMSEESAVTLTLAFQNALMASDAPWEMVFAID